MAAQTFKHCIQYDLRHSGHIRPFVLAKPAPAPVLRECARSSETNANQTASALAIIASIINNGASAVFAATCLRARPAPKPRRPGATTGLQMNERLRPWLHYNFGQLLSVFKRHEQALAEYQCAITINPGYTAAWRCIGFLQAQAKHPTAALEALNKALQLEPGDDATRFNIAFILHDLKRYPEAISEFEKIIGTSPKHDRAWYGLGICREQIGELENAAVALKQATQLQYFNPHAAYHLALLYHRLGQADNALTEYQRVLSFDPKCAALIRQETGIG
jgi:tetratricopeptide (TPR) repeat protein